MADQKEITAWFLNNHKELRLKATKLLWTKSWWPQMTDFQVSISVGGKEFIGRGINQSSDLAFVIACVEAVERSLCEHHNIPSNGLALHMTGGLAKQNALEELLERDAVLCHHLSETPLANFNGDFNFLDNLKEKLGKKNIKLIVKRAKISDSLNLFYSACFNFKGSKAFGAITGFGCSRNKEDALVKSLSECMMNVTAKLDKIQDKEKGVKYNKKAFSDKILAKSLYDYLMKEPTPTELRVNYGCTGKVCFKSIPLPGLFEKLPLVAYKAENQNLQSVFYGPTMRENINLERISSFLGKELSFEQINYNPHPVG